MAKIEALVFSKIEATGNDFVVFDARKPELTENLLTLLQVQSRAQAAARIADRRFGVGADGVIFLESASSPGVDFVWDFYNQDGSAAEMCGNAARGVAIFAFRKGLAREQSCFQTPAGLIHTQVLANSEVKVSMPRPAPIEWGKKLIVNGDQLQADYVSTGVPHLVLREEAPHSIELAQMLRNHPSLTTAGANVTFYVPQTQGCLQAVTYERGVENFTLSCGTGAVAAAFSFLHSQANREIAVKVPGGNLRVMFNKELTEATLMGPARIVFEGELKG